MSDVAGSLIDSSITALENFGLNLHEKENVHFDSTASHKIGHRRVDELGKVTYKRCPTEELRGALQLGIECTVGSVESKTTRDVLLQDFSQVMYMEFPSFGSKITPAHKYRDFRFKAYAPIAFQHFRGKFGIKPGDFLMSLCSCDWRELPNPGASGSIFFLSHDDKFIIKTVQAKEASFLLELLPGYYMNLIQNPETLLPKFFGLYCYQTLDKNIRVVVMNNIIPSSVHLKEKYDIKGSRYKRKASEEEKVKKVPTLKDLDFIENFKNGIFLDPFLYDTIINTLERDLRVLRSFGIMDYSLLIGICRVNAKMKTSSQNSNKALPCVLELSDTTCTLKRSKDSFRYTSSACSFRRNSYKSFKSVPNSPICYCKTATPSRMDKPFCPLRRETSLTCYDNLKKPVGMFDVEDCVARSTGIYCWSDDVEIKMFIGIIDILQNYRLKKRIEHMLKTSILSREEISVCDPQYYSSRFLKFIKKFVFKKRSRFLNIPPSYDSLTLSTNSKFSFGAAPTLYSEKFIDSDHTSSFSNSSTNRQHNLSHMRAAYESSNKRFVSNCYFSSDSGIADNSRDIPCMDDCCTTENSLVVRL